MPKVLKPTGKTLTGYPTYSTTIDGIEFVAHYRPHLGRLMIQAQGESIPATVNEALSLEGATEFFAQGPLSPNNAREAASKLRTWVLEVSAAVSRALADKFRNCRAIIPRGFPHATEAYVESSTATRDHLTMEGGLRTTKLSIEAAIAAKETYCEVYCNSDADVFCRMRDFLISRGYRVHGGLGKFTVSWGDQTSSYNIDGLHTRLPRSVKDR